MRGRNKCFDNINELLTCLKALSSQKRRMMLLDTHFSPGDLSFLIGQNDPALFIQVLLCLTPDHQIMILQNESSWVKENFVELKLFIALLNCLPTAVWPTIFAVVPSAQLNKQTFDVLLQSHQVNAENATAIEAIKNGLTDLRTSAELLNSVKALAANKIHAVSPLLDQFYHLVQSFDDLIQILAILPYDGERQSLFNHLGNEWFEREVKTIDQLTKIIPSLMHDDYPWLEKVMLPLVTDVDAFEKLHSLIYKNYHGKNRQELLDKLANTVLPHLKTDNDVARALVEFFPGENDAKANFCTSLGKQVAQRNPNLIEVLAYIDIVHECRNSRVSYSDPYREPRLIFNHEDFTNRGVSAFITGVTECLPRCVQTESDLQTLEDKLQKDTYLINNVYKILDSHLSKIITDPVRLRAARIEHRLAVEPDNRSAWTKFTTFVHDSMAPAIDSTAVPGNTFKK